MPDGRGRHISQELADVARQLDQMERWSRSSNFARQLARSGQSVQQFQNQFGALGAQFLDLNKASVRNHAMMLQVDKVMGTTGRTAGGLTGAFGRMIGTVRSLAGTFGPLLGPTALVGAARWMDTLSRDVLQFSQNARALNSTREDMARFAQGFRRAGLTAGDAEKQVAGLMERLQDISIRGLASPFAAQLEELGEGGQEVVKTLQQMRREGKNTSDMFDYIVRIFPRLTREQQIYFASALNVNHSIIMMNEQLKKHQEELLGSEEAAQKYRDRMENLSIAVSNFTTVAGAQLLEWFDTFKREHIDKPPEITIDFGDWMSKAEQLARQLGIALGLEPDNKTKVITLDMIIPQGVKDRLNDWWRSTAIGRLMSDEETLPATDPITGLPTRKTFREQPNRDPGTADFMAPPASPIRFQMNELTRIEGDSNRTLIDIRDILARAEAKQQGGQEGGTSLPAISPGGRFGGLTMPPGFGGPDAIALPRGGGGGINVPRGGGDGGDVPSGVPRIGGGGGAGVDPISGLPTGDHGAAVSMRGKSFAEKAPGIMANLQRDFGLTREQSAGVLGNLGAETGGFTQMQERRPLAGRGGWGWAQWTGPRRRAFEQWAAARNLDPRSDEANYGFLKHELQTSERGSLAKLKGTQSAQEAAIVFERSFERAGIKNYGARLGYTQRAMSAARAADAVMARTASEQAASERTTIDKTLGNATWKGSADINVNVKAPRGTTVDAAQEGFKQLRLERTPQMPVPDAGAGMGPPDYYE